MLSFLLIAVCILGGMLLRSARFLPADAHKGINAWIIYFALPAVSFKYLPHVQWSRELLLPVAGPIIVWLGGWLYIRFYAKKSRLNRATEGGLKLMSGLANTSFLGFPLVAAWFGEQYIGTAIICDQVTFILLSTAGIIVAMNSSEQHQLSMQAILKRLLRFVPFLACIAALVLPRFVDISFLDPLFNRLADTVAPLALFSIGLQLKFSGWKKEVKPVTTAIIYKLLLAPLLVLLLVLVCQGKGATAQVTVFEAAMPTLVSAGIVAEQFNLRPALCNLVIGLGIIVGFLTTTVWYYVITTLIS